MAKHTPIPMATGVRFKPGVIRAWRLGKEWSQDRAAKMCKMTHVTWRRCETGKLVQTLTAVRLAKRLGLKLSDVLLIE